MDAAQERGSLDIREMSFQNVVDQILTPNGVKMGGFPDEIFVSLTDEEQSEFLCNICYMILNEPRQCANKHQFCQTCIFAWSMTYGENSQKCPVCRCEQKQYEVNREIRRRLWDKKAKCPEEKCEYSASLRAFLMHNHGKERFCNEHVNFDELRPPRPDGARMLVLPNISLIGGSRMDRVANLRDQIHQGRMMIHQMMLLLHLEMQLRQQAVVSYNQATDPLDRQQRFDEVVALSEQLSEVGGVLSTLLNSPMHNIIAANNAVQRRSPPETSNPENRSSELSDILRMARETSNASESDSSTASDESQIRPTLRMDFRASRPSGGTTSQEPRRIELSSTRPIQRGVVEFVRQNSARERLALASTDNAPSVSTGRNVRDDSETDIPVTDIHPRVLLGGAANTTSHRSSTNTESNPTVEETTRVLTTSNTRVSNINTSSGTRSSNTQVSQGSTSSGTNSSTTTLPSINAGSNTSIANSVARRNIESQSNRPRVNADVHRPEVTRGSNGTVSTEITAQQLISARTRAQASTLSRANPVTEAVPRGRTPITYQSSSNAGNVTTPRIHAQSANTQVDSFTRTGPTIGPAIETEEPIVNESVTPLFEQRNTFRASIPSSTTTSRADSASRRSGTAQASQATVSRQPRYAPRLRQSQNTSLNTRANTSQKPTRVGTNQSPDRNNNRTSLNRQQDTSNRLSNTSNRRSLPNTISYSNDNGSTSESDNAVTKPPARRRNSTQNSTTIPRGPGTSGQLLRARRRSEIQKELMKSRENGNS